MINLSYHALNTALLGRYQVWDTLLGGDILNTDWAFLLSSYHQLY